MLVWDSVKAMFSKKGSSAHCILGLNEAKCKFIHSNFSFKLKIVVFIILYTSKAVYHIPFISLPQPIISEIFISLFFSTISFLSELLEYFLKDLLSIYVILSWLSM